MQNGPTTVAPTQKLSPPGMANWTPPEEDQASVNITGVRAKKIYINDNLGVLDKIIICFGEFLGTAMLVFIGCMGCISDIYTPSTNQPPHLQVSFTFGLAIMIAVQCFGHISGAHINPAVTIGAVVLGHTPVMQIPLYFGAQILGGIGGFGLLKVVTPDGFLGDGNSTGICSPNLGNKVTPLQGASIEFALTFMLVMVCAAVWDCRNSTKHDSLTIRLGLAVAVLAMAGGPFTTANMNPARSFGPALINGDWNNWWVWWVGPMLGGLVAGLLYRFVFSREHDDIEQHSPAEILHLNDKI